MNAVLMNRHYWPFCAEQRLLQSRAFENNFNSLLHLISDSITFNVLLFCTCLPFLCLKPDPS
jgi:hypothetical protein